ncbi:MAG TPA: polyribonucleotide nucleotidyltransferase, partial [Candidatus Absconditabacterales bacterium]|nr:polyribonucleotide nucleotidyltransferase [Candidatus Absconditabacterales bacterium]
TLYSRIVDRTLRPMFPKGMINDVVITITPLSFDRIDDMAILGILGGSLAVMVAGIPFDGPVSGVRVGLSSLLDTTGTTDLLENIIINPTIEQFENNGLNLIVSGKRGTMNMIEMDGNEVSEVMIEQAFRLGQKAIDELCTIQEEFLMKVFVPMSQFHYTSKLAQFVKYNYPPDELKAQVAQIITHERLESLYGKSKSEWEIIFSGWRDELRAFIDAQLVDDSIEDKSIYTREKCRMSMELLVREYFRELIIDNQIRIDGRKLDEIRPLFAQVGLLDMVHGSGLFRRGDTQIMNICTLGAPGDVQLIDDMMNDDTEKRYMHHYNFPPFSVNEAQKIRGTGNREIGHGRLAEKALEYVLPSKIDFPYTIRLVSDCLSSGGSTSMGSVCASTLCLMDAGVPIRKPVSGIAMGMCSRTNDQGLPTQYQILNDIQGAEDHHCDMDFKVAGTPDGITAIQLDMKVRGITVDIAMEVVRRANTGRLEIMEYMLTIIDKPRSDLSPNAPRITVLQIPAEKVKIVIGKGGETIDKIIAETGVKIDFEDDGTCMITSKDAAMVARTIEIIRGLTDEPKVGTTYDGEVTRLETYGIFVKFMNGKQGLVGGRTLPQGMQPSSFKLGQPVKVKLNKIDDQGRFDLFYIG